jgi:hypothetical protein
LSQHALSNELENWVGAQAMRLCDGFGSRTLLPGESRRDGDLQRVAKLRIFVWSASRLAILKLSAVTEEMLAYRAPTSGAEHSRADDGHSHLHNR